MRGVFVAGTDTGAGKSVVAASICAALSARGERVAAFKPAVTGLDRQLDRDTARSGAPAWPADHELLASAASAGQSPEDVAPYRFGPPVSPHLAAELSGTEIDPADIVERARAAADAADALVCEGVGGLMVPLTSDYLVRDLALELELPLLIAARPGLGTINHTLLTVESARAAGLRVAGVVMTPWPDDPQPIELSNRETVERLAGTSVSVLQPVNPRSLPAGSSALPLDDWLQTAH